MSSSFYQVPYPLITLMIFGLIIFFIWLGNFFAKKRILKYPEVLQENTGAIEGSVLGIMSLLLGFTFSVVVSRFEERRQFIIEDVKNVSTGILLCDMFPDSTRNMLRKDFKEYLEARIAYYDLGTDKTRIYEEIKKAKEISARIWKTVLVDADNPDVRARNQQMIPALTRMANSVIDREAIRITGVPPLILWSLVALVFISSFYLGTTFKGKKRIKIIALGYALVLTITLNLIIELNTPRRGRITLDTTQQKMIELRELFK